MQLVKWRVYDIFHLFQVKILRLSCFIKHMIIESLKQKNSLFIKHNIKLFYMTDKNFINLRGIAFWFLIFLWQIILWVDWFILRLSRSWNLSEFELKTRRSTFFVIKVVGSFIIDLVFQEIQVYSLLVYFRHAVFLWRIIFFHPWWLRVLMILIIFSFFEKMIIKILLR